MACDAGAVVMQHAADGSVVDVGRKTRTIPPALRRALQARDRQCRFPGCNARPPNWRRRTGYPLLQIHVIARTSGVFNFSLYLFEESPAN